jgi:hypothetical protein
MLFIYLNAAPFGFCWQEFKPIVWRTFFVGSDLPIWLLSGKKRRERGKGTKQKQQHSNNNGRREEVGGASILLLLHRNNNGFSH